MDNVFVTLRGRLRERWRTAFPGASVVATLDDVPLGRGVLWLDISALAADKRLPAVKSAISRHRPVVVMAATPSESEAFECLSAGAQGYCHVEAAAQQLLEVQLVVAHHGLWMPPKLLQRFLNLSSRVIPASPISCDMDQLTAREMMVAEHVASGASNREIAEALGISERTVKSHLSVIFEKFGVRDRVQLALTVNNIPVTSPV